MVIYLRVSILIFLEVEIVRIEYYYEYLDIMWERIFINVYVLGIILKCSFNMKLYYL